MPYQAKFGADNGKKKYIFGGNRCLGGETEIYDPILNISKPISQINKDFHVYAWNGYKLVIADASKPFKKDIDDIYKVILSTGESFTCSLKHSILTNDGYRPLSQCPVGCEVFHPQTNLDNGPIIPFVSVRRFLEKVQGFLVGCLVRLCSYDAQLRLARDSVQDVAPLQADVQGHISNEACEHKGGSHNRLKHNHAYQLSAPHSSWGDQTQSEVLFVDILWNVFYKLCKFVLGLRLVVVRSMLEFFRFLSIRGFSQQDNQCDCAMPSVTSYSVVTSIAWIREDVKWDLTVPKYGNYYAKGIIHHNSGKTEEGAEYIIKKCLAAPNQRWWAVAESFSDSVNIQQRKVWSLLPKNRIKYGNYNQITGFTNRKLLFDNGSIIIFKSYDQKREAFQSDDIDGVWNDEEPPFDIYKEQRMRLLDRDGEMITTMTSLKGITDLIQEVFEDHDVVETQYAPLVGKDLPRIVTKGDTSFYLFWTSENPYINQRRVGEEAKLMPRDEILSRIYGMPINLSGKIYMKFNKKVHVIQFEEAPLSECCIYNVLDPHDRKPWAIAWMAVHPTGTAYVFEEYPNSNFNDMMYDDKTYQEYATIIRETEEAIYDICGKRVIKRIIDPNFGNKTVQLAERQGGQSKTTPVKELAKLGLKYHDAIDALEAGHLEVRKWLYYDTNDDGIIVVQPKILITDNCQNTIRHLSRYSRKDIIAGDGDVKDKAAPMDKYKDYSDLVRYFCMANPRYIENGKKFIPKRSI